MNACELPFDDANLFQTCLFYVNYKKLNICCLYIVYAVVRIWYIIMCFNLQMLITMISRLMISVSRNDPLVSLNYAVFLYNIGDKAAAARHFQNVEKRLQSVAKNDIDAEVAADKMACFFFCAFEI